MACLNIYILELDWYRNSPFVQFMVEATPFVVAMPVGPLIYFYVRAVLNPDLKWKKKYNLHFLSVAIDLIPHFIIWFLTIGVITRLLPPGPYPGWGDFIDEYNAYADLPRWLSITIYVLLAWRYEMNRSLSENWLHLFLKVFAAFQFLWLLFLIPYIIPAWRYKLLDVIGWYPLYIPLVVMIYWLGMKGYLIRNSENTARKSPILSIPDGEALRILNLIKEAFDQHRLHLDPALTVATVAQFISVPAKTISYVLNNYHGKNFNEFVNEYRVEEVKAKILDPKLNNLTIAGIALECGFNSQATFQRSFKQITGMSPKEYLVKYRN